MFYLVVSSTLMIPVAILTQFGQVCLFPKMNMVALRNFILFWTCNTIHRASETVYYFLGNIQPEKKIIGKFELDFQRQMHGVFLFVCFVFFPSMMCSVGGHPCLNASRTNSFDFGTVGRPGTLQGVSMGSALK